MKIIGDPETAGIFTSALRIDWRLPNICQVEKCEEKPFVIACFDETETTDKQPHHVVVCKKHHDEAKEKGKFKYTIDFDKRNIGV